MDRSHWIILRLILIWPAKLLFFQILFLFKLEATTIIQIIPILHLRINQSPQNFNHHRFNVIIFLHYCDTLFPNHHPIYLFTLNPKTILLSHLYYFPALRLPAHRFHIYHCEIHSMSFALHRLQNIALLLNHYLLRKFGLTNRC